MPPALQAREGRAGSPACGAGWGGRRGPSLAVLWRGRWADTEQDGRLSSTDYTQGPPWVPVSRHFGRKAGPTPRTQLCGERAGRP